MRERLTPRDKQQERERERERERLGAMRCRRRRVEAKAEVDELTEWGGDEIQRECVRASSLAVRPFVSLCS